MSYCVERLVGEYYLSTRSESLSLTLTLLPRSGKSTQVPSFILEHDLRKGRPVKVFCTEVRTSELEHRPLDFSLSLLVSQPRRISAISLAQRVSSELGEPVNACGTRSSLVGYSIRLDSMVSASSRIVYATTVSLLDSLVACSPDR